MLTCGKVCLQVSASGLVYVFDPAVWHLGTPCHRLHLWPGTGLSLRRTAVDKHGADCSPCAGCSGSRKNWLLRFIDQEASGVPSAYRLGYLCANEHRWRDRDVTLRRSSDGRCPLCEQLRRGRNKEKISAYAKVHYQRNREHYISLAKQRYISDKETGRIAAYHQKTAEHRRRQSRAYRARRGCRSREQIRLEAALRRTRSVPTVAELVRKAQYDYWQIDRDAYEKERARCAKHKRRLRYLTDEYFRIYTRNKSKARKALLRAAQVDKISPASIRLRFAAFSDTCAYCGLGGVDVQIEHVIPLSRRGQHTLSNIVPAYAACNFSKGSKPVEDCYRNQPFFDPARLSAILAV